MDFHEVQAVCFLCVVSLLIGYEKSIRDEKADRPAVFIVVGVPGEAQYESQFHTWTQRWRTATERSGADSIFIGTSHEDETSDADHLYQELRNAHHIGRSPLWIVLIGHGSYDGRVAKFNLRGPDVSASELATWLEPFERPIVILNCSSASGPFVNELSARDRVIVTATRSGDEINFTRFGDSLSSALEDSAADLDKDGQISVLELFLTASSRTEEFYRTKSRLATEHAILDDNGDGLGTPADWFRGIHATKRAEDNASLDGTLANQIYLLPSEKERRIPSALRDERDSLESRIASLRSRKEEFSEDDYYLQLEALMVNLARIYQKIEPHDKLRVEPESTLAPESSATGPTTQ